jgi:hypothetical protein
MKWFLTYTCIIEALTGIGLILIPGKLISLIFGSPFDGNNPIMAAMIAGIAILSLALLCWFLRETENMRVAIKGLLFYNLILFLILIFGTISHGLNGPVLWIVILFHFVQSIMSIGLMNRKKKAI